MRKQGLKFQIVIVVFLMLALFFSVNAFAWGHGDGGHGGGGRGDTGHRDGGHADSGHSDGGHYYHGGGWYGLRDPYYYNDYFYYQTYPFSYYVVVPSPVVFPDVIPKPTESTVVTASTAKSIETAVTTSSNITNIGSNPTLTTQQDAFTVNIPNSKGGYTPVTLKRVQGGFTGPQGEFYSESEFPSVEQLKAMYGNKKD